ncbi:hypothetical protein ACFSM5_11420 [Lacibacterium aquatile]|uniref:DUF2946 domain-containing protein n=1 Tax=Lacibacterium aquatile TaxID=1168082 RepID=A0ABW5DW72_9PROT
MVRDRYIGKESRNRLLLMRRAWAMLAVLSILIMGFVSPGAAGMQTESQERAAIVALFGPGVLCETAQSDDQIAVSHAYHCMLCSAHKVLAPVAVDSVVVFSSEASPAVAWNETSVEFGVADLQERPNKPRDPPAIG